MDIKVGITRFFDKVYDSIFSAPNLDDAAKRYNLSLQGHEWMSRMEGGTDYDAFNPQSDEGQDIIEANARKLLIAVQGYENAHGKSPEMRNVHDILRDDYGIDYAALQDRYGHDRDSSHNHNGVQHG